MFPSAVSWGQRWNKSAQSATPWHCCPPLVAGTALLLCFALHPNRFFSSSENMECKSIFGCRRENEAFFFNPSFAVNLTKIRKIKNLKATKNVVWGHSITLTCNFNIFPLKQLYFVFSLFFVRYNAELSWSGKTFFKSKHLKGSLFLMTSKSTKVLRILVHSRTNKWINTRSNNLTLNRYYRFQGTDWSTEDAMKV